MDVLGAPKGGKSERRRRQVHAQGGPLRRSRDGLLQFLRVRRPGHADGQKGSVDAST